MGKKGKGRQCGGFDSKSQRAAYTQEIQWQVSKLKSANKSRQQQTTTASSSSSSLVRPRLRTGLTQLKSILRERQSQESFLLAERRRRAGFLPNNNNNNNKPNGGKIEIVSHPPGWILNYGKQKSNNHEYHDDNDEGEENDNDDGTIQFTSSGSGVSGSTQKKPKKMESLQDKCLPILAKYIMQYLNAMGRDGLHNALSLLPPESLANLSIAISTNHNIGITNNLAMAIGKHSHVEALSFRPATASAAAAATFLQSNNNNKSNNHNDDGDNNNANDSPLTDEGLLELVPLLNFTSEEDDLPESWEDLADDDDDDDDDDDNNGRHGNNYYNYKYNRNSNNNMTMTSLMNFDMLQIKGCNLRLKRLELIDCQSLSAEALITFFERCSCITHLSLAGSLPSIQDGLKVFYSLPDLLPALQVLDVTRCAWVSTSSLDTFMQSYYENGNNKPPTIHCEGCFRSTYQGTTLDW